VKVNAKIIRLDRCKEEYGSFFDYTDFSKAKDVFVNTDSWWAEAAKRFTAYIDAAMSYADTAQFLLEPKPIVL
jgi:hypothetical protein